MATGYLNLTDVTPLKTTLFIKTIHQEQKQNKYGSNYF